MSSFRNLSSGALIDRAVRAPTTILVVQGRVHHKHPLSELGRATGLDGGTSQERGCTRRRKAERGGSCPTPRRVGTGRFGPMTRGSERIVAVHSSPLRERAEGARRLLSAGGGPRVRGQARTNAMSSAPLDTRGWSHVSPATS